MHNLQVILHNDRKLIHDHRELDVTSVGDKQESPALPSINFPVFRRVAVNGYELFPGVRGTGFDHPFEPGLTVVAGVNGIGKTTFLNMLFRVLVGPFNPEKASSFQIGTKSHSLVGWNTPFFFRSRVSDEASSAEVYAEITIGPHDLRVTRRLSDLAITDLWFDDQQQDANEPEFSRIVREATNVSSEYDYDFLVRYLVFFLEQRVPLFWNEKGQLEIFRILLCESKLADEVQDLQDKITTLDSQYRNLRWQANKRAKELLKKREHTLNAGATGARIAALQSEHTALRDKSKQLIGNINARVDRRSDLKTKLLLQKIELEQQQRHYEGLQQNYLASVFPSENETATYIFSTLLAEHGCLVCGNRSNRGKERLTRLLHEHHCPVCESPPEDQERFVIDSAPEPSAMKVVADEINRLQHSIGELEKQEDVETTSLKDLIAERQTAEKSIIQIEKQLRALNAQAPTPSNELDALEKQIELDRDALKRMAADLEGMYIRYEDLITLVTQRVQGVANKIQDLFEKFARSFLSERCTLNFTKYKERLGEEKQFTYPCFEVLMTSATSPGKPTARKDDTEVSESQREFIDLAFRMALIAASSPSDSAAMLVIETPEASLDGYFIDQAGAMLRQFAAGGGDKGNVVIVSSNLNRQNMISALLGFTENMQDWPSSEEIDLRLINMLRIAKENAALRENRSYYENILNEAVKGRLTSNAHNN